METTEAVNEAPEAATRPTQTENLITGLHALADFLAQHPEVPCPGGGQFDAFVFTKDEMAAVARRGSWDKKWVSEWFCLTRSFPGGVTLEVNINRAKVCERIVVGERVVPAIPEHTVEVVEWKCDESLLSEGAA